MSVSERLQCTERRSATQTVAWTTKRRCSRRIESAFEMRMRMMCSSSSAEFSIIGICETRMESVRP